MNLPALVRTVSRFHNAIKLNNCVKCTRNYDIARFSTKITPDKRSNKDSLEDIELNSPIKYSSSPAFKWQATYTRRGTSKEPRLWYEPYVILASLSIFMIYFCILREENDVDEELNKTLYDRIEGLEEHQLRLSLKYNLDNGLSTTDIVKRLQEIEEAKANAVEDEVKHQEQRGW